MLCITDLESNKAKDLSDPRLGKQLLPKHPERKFAKT